MTWHTSILGANSSGNYSPTYRSVNVGCGLQVWAPLVLLIQSLIKYNLFQKSALLQFLNGTKQDNVSIEMVYNNLILAEKKSFVEFFWLKSRDSILKNLLY